MVNITDLNTPYSDFIENDRLEFRVFLDTDATSPDIQKAIWKGQHTCVTDRPGEFLDSGFDPNRIGLGSADCGSAVIRHQLKVEHFSVLNAAFIGFKCYNLPHSVIAQITRHRDAAFLVTSMRYTGDKFIDVADGLLNVEDVFYVRHPGEFRDRNGKTCIWTAEDREIKYEKIRDACIDYKYDVQVKNMPYEMAREFLPYCYRQNFDMFGTLESLFHLLDQRTKADAEREIRILSGLLFNILAKVAPELADWYLLNRYGKARLAP